MSLSCKRLPGRKLSALENGEIFARAAGRHVKMYSWSSRESSRGSLRSSHSPRNPPGKRRAGFAIEGKRFYHRQKTVLCSMCASLVRILGELQNKQYSFRGPFHPGNFLRFFVPFSLLSLTSPFYRISFPSMSFEWSANFSIVLRGWMVTR